MTFQECVIECSKNDELIREFNRLNGSHMSEPRKPIQYAINTACGYDPDKEAVPNFVAFVYRYIWLPLISKQRTEVE